MVLDIDVCVIRARTFSTDIIHLHECAYVGMDIVLCILRTYIRTYVCYIDNVQVDPVTGSNR